MEVLGLKQSLKNNKAAVAYTLFLAVLPILSVYYSGIPGFSIGDIGLAFFFVIALFVNKWQNKKAIKLSALYFGLFLSFFFSIFAIALKDDAQVFNVTIRIVRYFFYILSFLFTSSRLLILEKLKKYIVFITIVACAFLIIQFLIYRLFGVAINGFVKFIPLYSDTYSSRDYSIASYRPTSFFLEPAHFSRYAIIALCILLFDNHFVQKKSILFAVLIAICIIMSTSAQGYLLLAVVGISFVVVRFKNIKSKLIRCLIVLVIVTSPALIMLLLNNSDVSFTIKRVLEGDSRSTNSAVGARLVSYLYYGELPFLYKTIGVGFGSGVNGVEDVWFSGFARFLYGSGFLVASLFLLFSIYAVFKTKGAARFILLCFLILFFTDDSFCNYMCVLYYSIALLAARKNGKIVKNESIVYSY